MEGSKGVLDHVPIPRQQTEDYTAGEQRTNGEDATRTSAQVKYDHYFSSCPQKKIVAIIINLVNVRCPFGSVEN